MQKPHRCVFFTEDAQSVTLFGWCSLFRDVKAVHGGNFTAQLSCQTGNIGSSSSVSLIGETTVSIGYVGDGPRSGSCIVNSGSESTFCTNRFELQYQKNGDWYNVNAGNSDAPIAQFKRNRCSISPVELILQSGVRTGRAAWKMPLLRCTWRVSPCAAWRTSPRRCGGSKVSPLRINLDGTCLPAFCICPHSKKLTLSSVICSTRSAFLSRYPKRFRVTFKCLHIWYMCESRLPPQSPQQTVSQQFYIPFPLFPDM